MRALLVFLVAPLAQEEDRYFIDKAPVEFLKRWSEAEARQDWKGLVELYDGALERYPRRLWQADPAEERWVALPRALVPRLAAMPDGTRRPYEMLARQLLEANPGRAAREGVIERYAWTRTAQAASLALAAQAFDEGRPDEAVRRWHRATELSPPAEAVARLAHASVLRGDAAALERLRLQARRRQWKGDLVVAGRTVELGAYLDGLSVPPPAPEAPRLDAPPYPTPEITLGSYDLRLDHGAFGRKEAAMVPGYARLGGREYVVLTNGIRVTAIDPGRGSGGSLEEAIHWKFPSETIRDLPTPYPGPLPPLGAAISGRAAYVTMFSASVRTRLTGRTHQQDRFDGPAAIRAFDLASGKLLWDTDEIEVGSGDESVRMVDRLPFGQWNFCFAGPPVVRGDRLYVAVMTSPNLERQCYVLCLNVADGRTRWCTWVASLPAQRRSPTTIPTLVEDDGAVVVQTNLGFVAALDGATGRIEWLTRYAPTGYRHAVNAPVVHGGMAWALTQDRDELVSFELATGREVPLPGDAAGQAWSPYHHLAGPAGGALVLSGTQDAVFRPADGRLTPLAGRPPYPPRRAQFLDGRAYLSDASSLHVYDAATWKLLATHAWPLPEAPGHALVTDSLCLWLTDRLVVATSPPLLRRRFAARVEASPPRPDACRHLGEIFESAGRPREASPHYRRALEVYERDPAAADAADELRKKLRILERR